MIKFDPTRLRVEMHQLKSVTMAVGGSISVLDLKESTPKKEVMTRIVVPMAVVRDFLQRTKKLTKYLKPVWTAVVFYDNHVVAMERHPLGSMGALEEDHNGTIIKWNPMVELNIRGFVKNLLSMNREWFFDGRFMFSFEQGGNPNTIAVQGVPLTEDGKFRKCTALTFDLQSLPSKRDELAMQERSCLAFVSSRGAALSPPIWKNLSDVGMTKLRKADQEDEEDDDGDDEASTAKQIAAVGYNFDHVDRTLCVNLNFALKAGEEIGKLFGYEYVEPLQLPRLMIELHTVNLPNVANEIKSTYDTKMKFTHAMAWLLGLTRRAHTLDTYIMMRSLMKYLTKRGMYRSSVFDAQHVFQDGKSVENVKMLPLDLLLADDNFTKNAMQAISDQIRRTAREKKNGGAIHQIGGMLNEED